MEKMGKFLLIDPETGKLRSDEEAILCREVIADGDTKGSNRLIRVQSEIVPEFATIAEYYPDIGHFVKCISGGLHHLAKNCAELRGVSSLESARIKTMIADISRIVRQYGKQYKSVGIGSGSKEKVDELRHAAIKRIGSIIPHHWGEHLSCSGYDCKMIHLHRHYISHEEIIILRKNDIATDYAKVARFKGKVMSMGKIGQEKVYKEITSRLNEKTSTGWHLRCLAMTPRIISVSFQNIRMAKESV